MQDVLMIALDARDGSTVGAQQLAKHEQAVVPLG
jgi:hypothetical protein